MAARPPGGGGSSEPEVIEFGIAVLDARIEEAGVSFPATSEEIVGAIDDTEIPYDAAGRTVRLDAVVDKLPQRRFENETEFLNAVYPVFDEKRRTSGGVLSTLRDALPF